MSKPGALLVIISVMAPPPLNLFKEGGGGIFVCSVASLCESMFLMQESPSHYF